MGGSIDGSMPVSVKSDPLAICSWLGLAGTRPDLWVDWLVCFFLLPVVDWVVDWVVDFSNGWF